MSRQVPWFFAAFLLFCVSVAAAGGSSANEPYSCKTQEVQDLLQELTADSACGDPHGLTAIARLPTTRVVVFDPVSNSFSFVAPCGGPTPNEDRLDRRRLALPTQKLRLLVMPYNPADGDLEVEAVPGQGVEFTPTSSVGAPTQTTSATSQTGAEAAKTTDKKPPENQDVVMQGRDLEEKLQKNESKKAQAGDTKSKSAAAQKEQKFKGLTSRYENAPLEDQVQEAESLRQERHTDDPRLLLNLVSALFESYGKRVKAASEGLGRLHNRAECMNRHVEDVPDNLRVALSRDQAWTPARDNQLCTVLAEALRRRKLILTDGYESCPQKTNSKAHTPLSFEGDVQSFTLERDQVSADLAPLDSALSEISRNVSQMEVLQVPDFENVWKLQIKNFRLQIDEDRVYLKGLGVDLGEALKIFNQALQKQAQFKTRQGSQAANLHRENFNPLENGRSLTFKINRIETDGHRSEHPLAQIEIRSAPADNVRFGMGLVVSHLKDPSFKVGPVAASDQAAAPAPSPAATQDAQTTPEKKILFDDEGDGRLLPVILVHHYWGRRSGLLAPTYFERFVPTFSLGIPLAKADPLTQVVFGLDWELVPGIELNVGIHYGKVNGLSRGYKVGDPLNGVELTSIEKKTFASAFYFGIVLNSDTYKTLLESRQP